MKKHLPFLVMYDMWGLDTALKRAKDIGLKVTEEEIAEATRRDKDQKDLLNELFKEMTGEKVER